MAWVRMVFICIAARMLDYTGQCIYMYNITPQFLYSTGPSEVPVLLFLSLTCIACDQTNTIVFS